MSRLVSVCGMVASVLVIVKWLESLSHTSIIASYRETVLRCVESQIRIISRMRLIVNECEMCESHDTFVGIDLHFLTKVDLRFLLIVDGNTL